MEDIAALAGLTKRTLYNNYGDKAALFLAIVADAMNYVDAFVATLQTDRNAEIDARMVEPVLREFAGRLAKGVLRPEVIALRRLLVAEARAFPELASHYFSRAPLRVMSSLAAWFKHLDRIGLLVVDHPKRAASQFSYLVVGELLDRGVLTGKAPSKREIDSSVHEAIGTFLARYQAGRLDGRIARGVRVSSAEDAAASALDTE